MTNHSGLLGSENAVLGKKEPCVQPIDSIHSQTAAAKANLSAMDELLENTLLNVKLAEPLTKRETEILKLVVSGKTNKKIAHEICRTERTVEYHRHRLMRKLGANTAADLVKRAIAIGLV